MSSSVDEVVAGRVLVKRYLDSVLLMRLAQRLEELEGIGRAAALMGTDANKALLAEGGFATADIAVAQPDDVIVAVRASDDRSATAALERVDTLVALSSPRSLPFVASIDDALEVQPDTNLVTISVPGQFAAAEARHALERGLHAFVFSSGVAMEDEVALKQLADAHGLLCMGPDCGTAIIGGRGLGFANVVRRGPVGVVAAAGTGLQAVSSLLDEWGIGVSHAIGCGGRDLSDEVGGRTALAALRALEADPATSAILVVSKPPGPATGARIRAEAADVCRKPVVVCFLGDTGPGNPQTLDEAARAVAHAAGLDVPPTPPFEGSIDEWRAARAPRQQWIRGLYAGGTLAYEAQVILRAAGLQVRSNTPLAAEARLADSSVSEGHTIVDLGAEEFTRGRPHPMIDARVRAERIRREGDDPTVAALVLDVVLGYGAAADPAGDLAPAIAGARDDAARNGNDLAVVASVCGTRNDPQGRDRQEATLREVGAVVAATNAHAVSVALALTEEASA